VLGRLHYIANYRGSSDPARVLALISVVLEAGVPCVQLRAKDCSDRQRFAVARAAAGLCHDAGVTFIVNDRVDIALASGANGAHVGPDDIPVAEARKLLGPGPLLGASVRSVEGALAAVAAGADYLGTGPCFATSSKEGLPEPIGPAGLSAVAHGVKVPVVAIGGVTAARVPEVLGAGAHGVAVIGAIADANDPVSAARELVARIVSVIGAQS
jgi:thiamine-phosphate pyrophosphorylase